jgi:hypothetical protein
MSPQDNRSNRRRREARKFLATEGESGEKWGVLRDHL